MSAKNASVRAPRWARHDTCFLLVEIQNRASAQCHAHTLYWHDPLGHAGAWHQSLLATVVQIGRAISMVSVPSQPSSAGALRLATLCAQGGHSASASTQALQLRVFPPHACASSLPPFSPFRWPPRSMKGRSHEQQCLEEIVEDQGGRLECPYVLRHGQVSRALDHTSRLQHLNHAFATTVWLVFFISLSIHSQIGWLV